MEDEDDWENATCDQCGEQAHYQEFQRVVDGERHYDQCPACGSIQGD